MTDVPIDDSIEGEGTPGSPSGNILSIQGVAGMTPVDVTITGGGGGGTSQADKSSFTEGSGTLTPAGGVYNDTISSDPSEDQVAALRITLKRGLHTNLRDASGTEIGTSGAPIRVDPTGTTAQPITDNGGSVTIDGSVAATQSGTWNVTDITEIVSLPTGAATSANQATQTTSLQLIDDIVHTTNAALDKAAAIAGQLDDTTTTAATENNVAPVRITAQRGLHINLRNNSGTEIGISGSPVRTDPTGTTAQPVTDNGSTLSIDDGAGSITVDGTVSISGTVTTTDASLFAEDSAHASGNTGAFILGVRNDTGATTFTSANGDYSPFAVDSAGRLLISDGSGPISIDDNGSTISIDDGAGSITIDGTITVTQATASSLNATVVGTGTLAVQDSQVIADNAAFTDGTSKLFMGGHIFDDVAGTALTEKDAAASRIDSKRAQMFVIEDATTRGQKAAVSAAGALKVDGSAVTQPVSGTVTAAQATASSLNAQVVGDAASDGVDIGNPVKIGGQARQTLPTAVA